VGNAVREAILALAVVEAILDGADVKAALAHYRQRLLAAFARHLHLCRELYLSGRSGPWWDHQIDAAQRGLEWCKSVSEPAEPLRYRLRGFSLEAIDA